MPGEGWHLGLLFPMSAKAWHLGLLALLVLVALVPGQLSVPVGEISPDTQVVNDVSQLNLKNGINIHVEVNIEIDDDIFNFREEETTAAPNAIPAITTTTEKTTIPETRTTAITETTTLPVSCFDDPFGKGKCPENAGCFMDELGTYGQIGNHGFCHCYLGFHLNNSTNTCVDLRGGANCDEKFEANICYQDTENNAEFCPYCSVKKINEDMSMGNYVSGEGDFDNEDPQIFENGSSEGCRSARSTEAYWYCWYEAYPDPIVTIDSVSLEWWESSKCHSRLYVYTPLACCFADPDEAC